MAARVLLLAALCCCLLGSAAVLPATGNGSFLTSPLQALPAWGETHGIYTLTATPHYRHPVTGVIEDSGQNPGIGQGMTESVLADQALLEVDERGQHFITVRYSLMDNIEDVQIAYQKDAQSEWLPTPVTVMREDMKEGIADLRFAVSDEKAIVRAEFYVIPMGRVVVFYSDFHHPEPGSGDFLTSISVNQDIAAAQREQAAQGTAAGAGAAADTAAGAAADDAARAAADAAAPAAQGTELASPDPDAGLVVYRNDGSAAAEDEQRGPVFNLGSETLLLVAGVVALVVIAAVVGFVWLRVARKGRVQ
ncbi:MAG: hypothetical protein LBP28_06155 [Coriobacteriales bacterium]|jgi:hypothetical protein|nr:hypothetical protein [Coriobacteriales bacterium]